jgi:hypothetical protein
LQLQQINQVYIANSSKQPAFANNSQSLQQAIARMNSTMIASSKNAYHTVADAEFTGVYERIVDNFTTVFIGSVSDDYHLFIKFGNMVYMDVKGVGEIVMSFADLQQNKYWKYYYDLSLLLTADKNMAIESLHRKYTNWYIDTGNYIDAEIYDQERFWSIDTSYIEYEVNTNAKKIRNNSQGICFYNINPYDLVNMECSSQEDLNTFRNIYMMRTEITNMTFENKKMIYSEIDIDLTIAYIDEELNIIREFFEDKKNLINLVAFKEKKEMDGDLLMIIYNNIVSSQGKNKSSKYIEDFCNTEMTYKSSTDAIAQILWT